MSDHGSGPRATADPVLDISDFYAFPSPDRPGRFALAMMVFPFAPARARFSNAVDYRFRLRPLAVDRSGSRPAFAVADEERVISVAFDAPSADGDIDRFVQTGTCVGPGGETIRFRVGDEAGTGDGALRVFAGCRLDPFFIDQAVSGGIRLTRRLPERLGGRNSLDGQNVLGIVVEGDVASVFGQDRGPLFAAVAETTTTGTPRIRLERLGRPEIKNFVMLDQSADPVNRELEIRDIYNMEDAFDLRPDYLGAFRARLNGSLAVYDGLDGATDWPPDAEGTHPLTELLLDDYLVVDVTKPFDEDGYLEIERALLRGTPHATCGGRSLNHDMVDTFLTWLVNGGNGPRVSDGVDRATAPATAVFPYLQPANPQPPAMPTLVLTTPTE